MAQQRWTLSTTAAVGMVGITATMIMAGVGILVIVVFLPESLFQAEEERPWVIGATCLRVVNICQASLGLAAYILVSHGKARPSQLHLGMIMVFVVPPGQVIAMICSMQHLTRQHEILWPIKIGQFFPFLIRKAILYQVVKQKLAAFGESRLACLKLTRWADAMTASVALSVLAGVGIHAFGAVIHIHRGSLEPPTNIAFEHSTESSTVEVALMRFLLFAGNLGVFCHQMAGIVVLMLARRLLQTTVTRLAGRQVTAAMLCRVRSTLRLHFIGMVASIGTSSITTFGGAIQFFDVLGMDAAEDALVALLSIADIGGDVAGLLLLSGVWGLLFRDDDPNVGDFNHNIRSLLRSTVLTSRAESVFEGSLRQTRSNLCIASFPGKFIEDWNELTWLCEQGELSSACVFLPTSDPQERFGKHSQCPEDPTKPCWCYSLYGGVKPWGCSWFEVWQENVEKAVGLGLDLVVVFFPGQAGRGLVDWEHLPTADLWDGVGLGGSQKAEAAFLRRRGFEFVELDLEEARQLCLGRGRDLAEPSRRPGRTPPA